MAPSRAFKNLASLRDSFSLPVEEEQIEAEAHVGDENTFAPTVVMPSMPATVAPIVESPSTTQVATAPHQQAERPYIHAVPSQPVATAAPAQKIDRRHLRKVLKTPATKITAHVRVELYEDVSAMIFARKTTWIAVIDELLQNYVTDAKAKNQFPK